MTIADAITQYQKSGTDSVNRGFREIVNRLIEQGIKTDFKNDSYLDALYLTDVMFHRANRSIRLLTGPGIDGFLTVLKHSLVEALERLKETGGEIKVILLSKEMPPVLANLMQQFPGTLFVRRAVSKEPMRHFIVCDTKITRHEEIHEPLTPECPATMINASVSFNDPTKAHILERYFETLWETVASYPVNRAQGVTA